MSGMWLSICIACKVCTSGRNNAYASAAGEHLAGGAPARELGIPSLHHSQQQVSARMPEPHLSPCCRTPSKTLILVRNQPFVLLPVSQCRLLLHPPSHGSGQDDEQELEHEQRTRRAFQTKRIRLLAKTGIIHAHTVETPAPEHLDRNLCRH